MRRNAFKSLVFRTPQITPQIVSERPQHLYNDVVGRLELRTTHEAVVTFQLSTDSLDEDVGSAEDVVRDEIIPPLAHHCRVRNSTATEEQVHEGFALGDGVHDLPGDVGLRAHPRHAPALRTFSAVVIKKFCLHFILYELS